MSKHPPVGCYVFVNETTKEKRARAAPASSSWKKAGGALYGLLSATITKPKPKPRAFAELRTRPHAACCKVPVVWAWTIHCSQSQSQSKLPPKMGMWGTSNGQFHWSRMYLPTSTLKPQRCSDFPPTNTQTKVYTTQDDSNEHESDQLNDIHCIGRTKNCSSCAFCAWTDCTFSWRSCNFELILS